MASPHRRHRDRARHPPLTRNTWLPTVRRAHRVHFPPLLGRAPPSSQHPGPSTSVIAPTSAVHGEGAGFAGWRPSAPRPSPPPRSPRPRPPPPPFPPPPRLAPT